MSQGITLAKAIKVFRGELGCGTEDDREILIDAIKEALEFMLLNGGGEILQEWLVTVRKGRFTFPRDLETPIKFKRGVKADCGFGTIQSAFYPYSSQSLSTCCGFYNWDQLHVAVSPGKVSTEFHPPKQGLRLLATTKDERDVGKHIMVNGSRCTMPLKPTHNNYKTAGEFLTIYHEDDKDKKYGAWVFDKLPT